MSYKFKTDYETITVTPLEPTIGAEIRGVKIGPDIPEQQLREIEQATIDWKMVCFPDQPISTADFAGFGHLMGDVRGLPFDRRDDADTEFPEVIVLHHDENNTEQTAAHWHTDIPWCAKPATWTILLSRIMPKVGGDTVFADMEAAYEGLSDEIKAKIEGARAVHDFGEAPKRLLTEYYDVEVSDIPPVSHPVVRTHPVTGRKSLYVNEPFTLYIEGMEDEEGKQLLDYLAARARVLEYQCRLSWEENMVVMWDNRNSQHYAVADFAPATRRLERVTIAGDTPV